MNNNTNNQKEEPFLNKNNTNNTEKENEAEVLKEIDSKSKNNEDILNSLNNQEREIKIKDQESDLNLKNKYANYFLWILIGQLVVMNLIMITVGFPWFNFNFKDENILRIYMAGTLLEVFGIVLVITRYLFSKK